MSDIVRRDATEDDIAAIVEMGVRFFADSRYATILPADPAAMEETARRLVGGGPPGFPSVVLLVESNSVPVAMLGLATYSHPITGQRAVAEMFYWVEPSHRGITGVKLLRSGERWARDTGAKIFQVAAPTDMVADLYSRCGYAATEIHFTRVLS